jgi:hypothetical protein
MANDEGGNGTWPEPTVTRRRRYGYDLLPGVALSLVFSIMVLWQTIGTFEPTEPRAVVFAPWLGRAEVWTRVVAADGRVVREGRWPFVIVVEPGSPDFSDRVRRLGAWMELDPKISADCTAQIAP